MTSGQLRSRELGPNATGREGICIAVRNVIIPKPQARPLGDILARNTLTGMETLAPRP